MDVYAQECVWTWMPRLMILGAIIDLSSTFFNEAGSLNQIQNSSIYLSVLLCMCVGSPMSSFWGWNYRWVIKPTWHLHGFWRSEFHASFLHSKHLATEPFFLLPKFIFHWKYLLFEIHGFKSCHYLEMTIQISLSLVYSSRKTSKHVNGQIKSGCGVRGTQQSWNLAE